MAQPKPPFRADHVGSLLRPPALRQAHEAALAGSLDAAILRTLEDRHIRAAVAWQEAIGLDAVTDGEFRRTSFHFDFLERLEGVVGHMPPQFGAAAAAAEAGKKPFAPPTLSIAGKLRHVRPILADAFAFLKSATMRTPKLTMPSPTMLMRAGRDQVDRAAYPDMAEFHADIAAAWRGNLHGAWAAEGGYEPIAEAAFAGLEVDGFLLEYDSARAGGFAPLRHLPRGKRAVLGLVSSKLPELETREALLRRIDEAAEVAPIDSLCLSPQCGFASSYRGNPVSEDIEKRKLELVVKVADEVWGRA